MPAHTRKSVEEIRETKRNTLREIRILCIATKLIRDASVNRGEHCAFPPDTAFRLLEQKAVVFRDEKGRILPAGRTPRCSHINQLGGIMKYAPYQGDEYKDETLDEDDAFAPPDADDYDDSDLLDEDED